MQALERIRRADSFGLFSAIVAGREISAEQRLGAWGALQAAAANGTLRDFCRALVRPLSPLFSFRIPCFLSESPVFFQKF